MPDNGLSVERRQRPLGGAWLTALAIPRVGRIRLLVSTPGVIHSRNLSNVVIAMIPLLFGIQQMTEGVIWLTLSHDAPISKQLFVLLPACSSS